MPVRPLHGATTPHLAVTLALAVAAAVVHVGVVTPAPSASAATVASFSIKGVDVASWQHPSGKAITWSKVKGAGYSFAIVKATESTTYTNPYFVGDRAGALQAGMVVGTYHFARPKLPISTAADQARYFVKTIGTQQLTRTLPPVLDIESTGGLSKANLSKWMSTFLTTVRSSTGRTPMIYSYDSFLRNNVDNIAAFSSYPLWYANYTTSTPKALPGSWSKFQIWQHSSSGTVPGISGRTDLNRFNGSYSNLIAFASGQIPATQSQRATQPWEPVHLSGRVDPAYAGEPVVRQIKSSKGTWKTVSKKRVWGNGGYLFAVKPAAKGSHQYRLLLDSRSPYARVPSRIVTITVSKPWLKVGASTRTLTKGSTASLTGRVDPFYAGEKVLRQKRSASGRWTTVSTKRVTSTGRFTFGVRPTQRTTHSYRVLLRATGPKANVTSRTLKIRVK